MSSSTQASQGEVAQQAAPSTPGPIRRQPQNTLIKHTTVPYTTKQAIQNNVSLSPVSSFSLLFFLPSFLPRFLRFPRFPCGFRVVLASPCASQMDLSLSVLFFRRASSYSGSPVVLCCVAQPLSTGRPKHWKSPLRAAPPCPCRKLASAPKPPPFPLPFGQKHHFTRLCFFSCSRAPPSPAYPSVASIEPLML